MAPICSAAPACPTGEPAGAWACQMTAGTRKNYELSGFHGRRAVGRRRLNQPQRRLPDRGKASLVVQQLLQGAPWGACFASTGGVMALKPALAAASPVFESHRRPLIHEWHFDMFRGSRHANQTWARRREWATANASLHSRKSLITRIKGSETVAQLVCPA